MQSPFYGKTLSAEHKKSISEAMKRKCRLPEHSKKISVGRRGKEDPRCVFEHPKHGQVIMTPYDLMKMFDLNGNLYRVVDGDRPTCKGWKCLGPALK